MYRDFFMVPAAEAAIGEARRYEFDKIDQYPELLSVFDGFFGKGGLRPTFIALEPSLGAGSIADYLGNRQINFVVIDKLGEGCQFTFGKEDVFCGGSP